MDGHAFYEIHLKVSNVLETNALAEDLFLENKVQRYAVVSNGTRWLIVVIRGAIQTGRSLQFVMRSGYLFFSASEARVLSHSSITDWTSVKLSPAFLQMAKPSAGDGWG
ncbi:hypothetical protein AO263_28560 [Pseudomonas sp. NZIPFR-PS5]|nr:hypothetical protein AO263_28560 [Pseudomonas sp. NZIPFR-PS5]